MRVKELLLQALARANHIEDGAPAEAREISKARAHFNSALSKYSSSSLITAFQHVSDVPYSTDQVIGRYNLKKGLVMHEALNSTDQLPNPNAMTPEKDYGHLKEQDEYFSLAGPDGSRYWMQQGGFNPISILHNLDICDYIPDVILTDIERIMSCMCRPKSEPNGRFDKMNFVPLVNFYSDDSKEIYNAAPAGENKVRLLLPAGMENYDFRIVYYTKMEFSDNDYIELPDAYKELLTLAVTVGLLSEDADSDPTQYNNYSAQLASMENLIGANNVTTRRLVRDGADARSDLRTGAFIRRRLCR